MCKRYYCARGLRQDIEEYMTDTFLNDSNDWCNLLVLSQSTIKNSIVFNNKYGRRYNKIMSFPCDIGLKDLSRERASYFYTNNEILTKRIYREDDVVAIIMGFISPTDIMLERTVHDATKYLKDCFYICDSAFYHNDRVYLALIPLKNYLYATHMFAEKHRAPSETWYSDFVAVYEYDKNCTVHDSNVYRYVQNYHIECVKVPTNTIITEDELPLFKLTFDVDWNNIRFPGDVDTNKKWLSWFVEDFACVSKIDGEYEYDEIVDLQIENNTITMILKPSIYRYRTIVTKNLLDAR